MKRKQWWTLAGVVGTALAASLAGLTVWGQPGGAPLPPITTRPELPAPKPIAAPTRGPDVVPPSNFKSDPPLVGLSSVPMTWPSAPVALPGGDPAMATVPVPVLEKDTTDTRLGKQQPSLSLEWIGPPTARVKQPMPYQLVVRNTSDAAVQNVVVRQKLPQGVTCKGSDPKVVTEAGDLVWNLGTLAPDQTRRIDVQLVAQTRGTLNCQATVTFSGTASHQVQVREPQLAIKMQAPDKVVMNDTVVLLFAVSNPGDGTAESVTVKVLLPDGLEYKGNKSAEVDVGNLAPGDVRTMQLPCEAKGSGTQKCLVIASADGGITSNDKAQIEILIPKLGVTMSGPKLRYLDRPAVYVAKVTNLGSMAVANVELYEIIPAGYKFTAATKGGQYQETTRTVTWSLGELQPGQAEEVAVDVVPIEPGEHRMTAQARSGRGLMVDTEVRTVVEGLPSLLIELVNTDNPVEVGAETAYELRVINTGTKSETGVEVTCTLPEQFEFKGAKCSTTLRYRLEGRQLTFESLPQLAPKADVIYRIQVCGKVAADVRIRARIKSDGMRDPVVREESTRIYSDDSLARPQPNLTAPSTPPAKSISLPLKTPSTPESAPKSILAPTTSSTPKSSVLTPAVSKPAAPAPGAVVPVAAPTTTTPAPLPLLPLLGTPTLRGAPLPTPTSVPPSENVIPVVAPPQPKS